MAFARHDTTARTPIGKSPLRAARLSAGFTPAEPAAAGSSREVPTRICAGS